MEETGPYVCEHLFMKYECSIYCNALKLNMGDGVNKNAAMRLGDCTVMNLLYFFFVSFSFCGDQNVVSPPQTAPTAV